MATQNWVVTVTNMAKTKLRKAVSKPRRKITRKVRTTKQANLTTKRKPNTKPTGRPKKLRGGEHTEHVVVDGFAWLTVQYENGVLEAWLLDKAYCDNHQAKYPYMKFEPTDDACSTAVGFEEADAYQNADLPTRDAFGMPQ